MLHVDDFFDMEDETAAYDMQDVQDGKAWSILAYLGILFFLPLVCAPHSKFGRFHANQGLVLFITSLILGFVRWIVRLIIGWIPFLGSFVVGLLSVVIAVVILTLAIIGIVNASQGNAKELPIIGKFRLLS